MADPEEIKKDVRSEAVQDVKDAVRDLNDAIAVAAAHGIELELDVFQYHHVGEVPHPVVEVRIRRSPRAAPE